ncbi:hypothetical protein BKA62DRAFT_753021 [Auriculariales sp. MPI-PUGE-AT-0066]|nr:hypothetical protein BKA62DRAFT_753021 [Auriculariales sp. MPI-PUGE-AT-0066]
MSSTTTRCQDIVRSIATDEARIIAPEIELRSLRKRFADNKFRVAAAACCPRSCWARIAALFTPSCWATFMVQVAAGRVTRSGITPERWMWSVHRLESLVSNADRFETAQAALEACAGPAPILRSLHVVVSCDYTSDLEFLSALEKAFNPAPEFREMRLQHCAIPPSMVKANDFAFMQLIYLHFGHIKAPLQSLKRTLELMPYLKRLKLAHWSDIFMDEANITLPTLNDLILVDAGSPDQPMIALLDSLTTPALHNLTTDNFTNWSTLAGIEEDDPESFKDFIHRCNNPPLRLLVLNDSQMPHKDLMRTLRKLKRIEELTLCGTPLPGNMWGRIIRRERRTWPHTDIKPVQLAKVIKARNLNESSSVAPLRHIGLYHCRGGSRKDRVSLAKLDPTRLKVHDTGPPNVKRAASAPSVHPLG